jgi:hypothetical protein
MRLKKGDPKQPLLAKPALVVDDLTAGPAKIVRRVRTGKPVEDWKQPPRNLRAIDFSDGPEPGELN